MKLITSLKINIFLIAVILIQYIPLQVNIEYQYTPELLSLLIYIIYLLRQDTLSYVNIFLLSLLNDLIKLYDFNTTIIQSLLYIFYINIFKTKYSRNIFFDSFNFSILHFIILPSKYIILNFLHNHEILAFHIALYKTLITIVFFPLFYYSIGECLCIKNKCVMK